MFSVRSPLIFSQLAPRLVLLNRFCAPMYHVLGSCFETTKGVSQFQRYPAPPRPAAGGPSSPPPSPPRPPPRPPPAAGRSPVPGRTPCRSSVSMLTHAAFPFCDDCSTRFGFVGSKCAWKPSPPPMFHASRSAMPFLLRTALGTHHTPLSCKPPQMRNGTLLSTSIS